MVSIKIEKNGNPSQWVMKGTKEKQVSLLKRAEHVDGLRVTAML